MPRYVMRFLIVGLAALAVTLSGCASSSSPATEDAAEGPAARGEMLNDEELLNGFIEETREHLAAIDASIRTLQASDNYDDSESINLLFRSAHSIKGGAGFFGLENMSSVAERIEYVLSRVREGRLELNKDDVAALANAFATLNTMVENIADSESMDTASIRGQLDEIVRQN